MKCCLRGPKNIVLEKNQRNVFLILLGQHLTAQNPMQYYLRGSREYFTRKNPIQCGFNTLGITLYRLKLYAMLSEKFKTTLYKKKLSAILS